MNSKLITAIIVIILLVLAGSQLFYREELVEKSGEIAEVVKGETNIQDKSPEQSKEPQEKIVENEEELPNEPKPQVSLSAGAPEGLSLPFRTEDIDEFNGGINPIGVVRFAKDRSEIGHSGLDVPLFEAAEIFAVADGEIVLIQSAGDPWNGQGIFQLLKQTSSGEGWGYIYEHIIPREGLKEGDVLKRGEILGIKAAPKRFTAHFQYSFLFNNFQYINNIQCWPDQLTADASTELNTWWERYRESEWSMDGWNGTFEEGAYPFRGLLDKTKYPNGLELCYPLGTDVR